MALVALSVCTLYCLSVAYSYNISWSEPYEYYDGGTQNPYLINLRRSDPSPDPEYLLICFEQSDFLTFAGICETLELDISANEIRSAAKEEFKPRDACNCNLIQIYDEIWTNNFLLAYTNGPSAHEGPGQVLIGSFDPGNQGSITYGEDSYAFNSGLNDQSRLVELQSNGYVVICSAVGSRGQYDTECKIAQYNTDQFTMAIGTKTFKMTTGHQTNSMVVQRIASDGFIACFVEYIQSFGACYVGTVQWAPNGLESEIVFSNENVFHNNNQNPIDEIKLTHVNATMLAMCYTTHTVFGDGGNGTCRYVGVSQMSGLWTVSILPQIYQFADHATTSLSLFHVNINTLYPDQNNPELIVACYVDDTTDGYCRFATVDLDAPLLRFEDGITENFHPSGTRVGSTTTSYLGYGRESGEANYVVICYTQYAGSTPLFNRGYCRLGTITVD